MCVNLVSTYGLYCNVTLALNMWHRLREKLPKDTAQTNTLTTREQKHSSSSSRPSSAKHHAEFIISVHSTEDVIEAFTALSNEYFIRKPEDEAFSGIGQIQTSRQCRHIAMVTSGKVEMIQIRINPRNFSWESQISEPSLSPYPLWHQRRALGRHQVRAGTLHSHFREAEAPACLRISFFFQSSQDGDRIDHL